MVQLDVLRTSAKTAGGRYDVAAASAFILDVSPSGITGASAEADSTASSSTGAGTPPARSGTPDKDIIAFSMKKGEARRFSLVASVCSTADFSDPWNETVRQIVYIDRVSADEILAGHRADWAGLWESDIVIEGSRLSIPPMGLSSQGYSYEGKVDPVDGPAMTWSIFCVQYARLGDMDKAYEMFLRCYRPFSRPLFGALAETPASDNPYFVTAAGGLLQAVLSGSGLSVSEYLCSVILCVDLLYDALKYTVFIEYESAAQRPHHCLSIHLLFAPCPERLQHPGGCIGKQSKRELILSPESLMGGSRVLADPHDIISGFRQG